MVGYQPAFQAVLIDEYNDSLCHPAQPVVGFPMADQLEAERRSPDASEGEAYFENVLRTHR